MSEQHAKPGRRSPLVPPGHDPGEPRASRTLLANDHLRMLIELIRPATPDLARRWTAALLMAPEEEREAIVEAVERRMTELYHGVVSEDDEPAWLHVSGPEVERDGYTERVERTYEVRPDGRKGVTRAG